MNNLKNCILNQVSMDEKSMDHILSFFKPLNMIKGDFFIKSGRVCNQMAFINSGYVRMYDTIDGKEVTFWIGGGKQFFTALSSFIFETGSNWNIKAITDCELYVISRESHFKLTQKEPKWLEFENLLLANSFAVLEKKMLSQLHTTAKQRFDSLLEEEPDLFKNVPLQFIASMIGITPESLSRLRRMN